MAEADADVIEMLKALSNEYRLRVLQWLRDSEANFEPQGEGIYDQSVLKGGVCVGSIQRKLGLSQSTASNYMSQLQRAGLVIAERHGKWTYYRRNEDAIARLREFVEKEL